MIDTRHLLKLIGDLDDARRTEALVWLAATVAPVADREALADALDAVRGDFYDIGLAQRLDEQYGADAAAALDDLPAKSVIGGGSHEWDDLRSELARQQKTR